MSEPRQARQLLEMAEHAALEGNLASADELLREAARLQEAELGPLHPDLANTLNNLAIVAEKTGRPGDAETFFRRAVAIASTSLPADHPMVIESRKNLEDFCRDRGLPIAAAAVTTPSAQPVHRTSAPAPPSPPPSPARPAASSRPPAPSRPPGPLRSSPPLAWVVTGAIVVVVVALLVWRPWSSPEVAPPNASQDTPPAPAAPAAPTPIEKAQPPVEKTQPPKPAPPGGISLITAQVCQTFSTSDSRWRCDPVGTSAAAGRLALYTRVRSSRDATVVHRWYRNDTLQQSVKLEVDANAAEGYRTYSRQTVGAGNWRVEVLNANGDLLHEQRFSVK